MLLNNIRWSTYESLLDDLSDRRLQLTNDRGDLGIMTRAEKHERAKTRIGRLIDILAEIHDLPIEPAGSTTFKNEELEKGFEPDECYLLEANIPDDKNSDRIPVLAVEVDNLSSSLNRMGIYAAFGVPELWHFKDGELTVMVLEGDSYTSREQSLLMPWLPMDTFGSFLHRPDGMRESPWIRKFRAWAETLTTG